MKEFLDTRYYIVAAQRLEANEKDPSQYVFEMDGRQITVLLEPSMVGKELPEHVNIIFSEGKKPKKAIAVESNPKDWTRVRMDRQLEAAAFMDSIPHSPAVAEVGSVVGNIRQLRKDESGAPGSEGRFLASIPSLDRLKDTKTGRSDLRNIAVRPLFGFSPKTDKRGNVQSADHPIVVTEQNPDGHFHEGTFLWQYDAAQSYVGALTALSVELRNIDAVLSSAEQVAEDDPRKGDIDNYYATARLTSINVLKALNEYAQMIDTADVNGQHPPADVFLKAKKTLQRELTALLQNVEHVQQLLPDEVGQRMQLLNVSDVDTLIHQKDFDGAIEYLHDFAEEGNVPKDSYDRDALRLLHVLMKEAVDAGVIDAVAATLEARGGLECKKLMERLGVKPLHVPDMVSRGDRRLGPGQPFERTVDGDDVFLEPGDVITNLYVDEEGMVHFDTLRDIAQRRAQVRAGGVDSINVRQHCSVNTFLRMQQEGIIDVNPNDNELFVSRVTSVLRAASPAEILRIQIERNPIAGVPYSEVMKNAYTREELHRTFDRTMTDYVHSLGFPADASTPRMISITPDLSGASFVVSVGSQESEPIVLTGNESQDKRENAAVIEWAKNFGAEDEQAQEKQRRENTIALLSLAHVSDLIPWFRGTALTGAQVDNASYAEIQSTKDNGWTAEHAKHARDTFNYRVQQYVIGLAGGALPQGMSFEIERNQPNDDASVLRVTLRSGAASRTLEITGDESQDRSPDGVDLKDVLVFIEQEAQHAEEARQDAFVDRLRRAKDGEHSVSDIIRWYRGYGDGQLPDSGESYTFPDLRDEARAKALEAITARVQHYIGINGDVANVRLNRLQATGELQSLSIEIVDSRSGDGRVLETAEITGFPGRDKEALERWRENSDASLRELKAERLEEYKTSFLESITTLEDKDIPGLVRYMNGESALLHIRPRVDQSDFVSTEDWDAYVLEMQPALVEHAYRQLRIDPALATLAISPDGLQKKDPTEISFRLDVNRFTIMEDYSFNGDPTLTEIEQFTRLIDKVRGDHHLLGEYSAQFTEMEPSPLIPGTIVRYQGEPQSGDAGVLPFMRNGELLVVESLHEGNIVLNYAAAKSPFTNAFDSTFSPPNSNRVYNTQVTIPAQEFARLFQVAPDGEEGEPRLGYAPQWMVERMPDEFVGPDVFAAIGLPDTPTEFFWSGEAIPGVHADTQLEPGMRVKVHEHRDGADIKQVVLTVITPDDVPNQQVVVRYEDIVNAKPEAVAVPEGEDDFVLFLESLIGDKLPRLSGGKGKSAKYNGDLNLARLTQIAFVDSTPRVVKQRLPIPPTKKEKKRKKKDGAKEQKRVRYGPEVDVIQNPARCTVSNIGNGEIEIIVHRPRILANGKRLPGNTENEKISYAEFSRRVAAGHYQFNVRPRPFTPVERAPRATAWQKEKMKAQKEGRWPSADAEGADDPENWGLTEKDLEYSDFLYGGIKSGAIEDWFQKSVLKGLALDNESLDHVKQALRDVQNETDSGARERMNKLRRVAAGEEVSGVDYDQNEARRILAALARPLASARYYGSRLSAGLINIVPALGDLLPPYGKAFETNRAHRAHPAFVAQCRARGFQPWHLIRREETYRELVRSSENHKIADVGGIQITIRGRTYTASVTPNGPSWAMLSVHLTNHPHYAMRDNQFTGKRRSLEMISIDDFFRMCDNGRVTRADGTPFRPAGPFGGPGEETPPAPTPADEPTPAAPTAPPTTEPPAPAEPVDGDVPIVESARPAPAPTPAAAERAPSIRRLTPAELAAEDPALTPEAVERSFQEAIARRVPSFLLEADHFSQNPTAEHFARGLMRRVRAEGDYRSTDAELAVAIVAPDAAGRKKLTFLDPKSAPIDGDTELTYHVQPDQITGGEVQIPSNALKWGEAVYYAGYTHQVENSVVAHFNTDSIRERTLENPAGFARVVTQKAHEIAAHMRGQIALNEPIQISAGEFSLDRQRNDLMAAASLLNMLYPERPFVVVRDDENDLAAATGQYAQSNPDAIVIVVKDEEDVGTTHFDAVSSDDDFVRMTMLRRPDVMTQIVENARTAAFTSGMSYEARVEFLLAGVDRSAQPPADEIPTEEQPTVEGPPERDIPTAQRKIEVVEVGVESAADLFRTVNSDAVARIEALASDFIERIFREGVSYPFASQNVYTFSEAEGGELSVTVSRNGGRAESVPPNEVPDLLDNIATAIEDL